jgi:hypothetical protein
MADGYDDLVVALRDVGERVDLPSPADPVAGALDRIRSTLPADRVRPAPARRIPRVLALAAAVVIVAVAATLVAPGPRGAVARWLGIGQVTVTYVGEIPERAGREYDLGRPVDLDDAAAAADRDGWRLAAPAGVGAPHQAFAGRPAGSVTLAWAPSAELPEIGGSGLGLVLTAMPGTTDAGGMSKQVARGTSVELTRVGDHPAYWISGAPHEVVVTGPDGTVVRETSRLAGNALVWTEDGLTYRLESALARDEAVELGSNLVPWPRTTRATGVG